MKLRRLAALALVAALLLCCAAPALAQSDKAFIKQMKKLDKYLRTYADAADVGENAVLYILNDKAMQGMDLARLEFLTRVYLGCSGGVRMATRLDAYARDISNTYLSISDLCERGYTPEQAAESARFARKYAGASFGRIDAPAGYEEPEPAERPVCCN